MRRASGRKRPTWPPARGQVSGISLIGSGRNDRAALIGMAGARRHGSEMQGRSSQYRALELAAGFPLFCRRGSAAVTVTAVSAKYQCLGAGVPFFFKQWGAWIPSNPILGQAAICKKAAGRLHESIPDEWIDRVLAVMALCPQHTFQVFTKRAARMRDYLTGPHRVHVEMQDHVHHVVKTDMAGDRT